MRSLISFAIASAAAVVTIWLALQMLGFLFKLLFIAAAGLVIWAAVRAWREPEATRR